VPHIDDHHAIVGSCTGVRYALRLLAGGGMLKLFIVGGKELVRVSLPPEQNEYGHCTLLPGLLGCVRHLPLNHHRHDAIEEGVAHPSRAYSPKCVERLSGKCSASVMVA
jgi:hypothetical protein